MVKKEKGFLGEKLLRMKLSKVMEIVRKRLYVGNGWIKVILDERKELYESIRGDDIL